MISLLCKTIGQRGAKLLGVQSKSMLFAYAIVVAAPNVENTFTLNFIDFFFSINSKIYFEISKDLLGVQVNPIKSQVQSTLDISKLWRLFFTSSNCSKCKIN